VKITQLAQQLFISQSRFEKRFRRIVGTSAKKFAGIVRLRCLLEMSVNERNLTTLGLSAGYFDQAHFIKDFRSMTGETPGEYFKI
jgi:AraC-like DNA-binding protein